MPQDKGGPLFVAGSPEAKRKTPASTHSPGGNPDPIDDAKFDRLLVLVDVVRDPLHGDIHLTALERSLVDSPEFQRLRNVSQLGMTYTVYPGAVHTRFIHALGTLHVCSGMITTCNANAKRYARLNVNGDPVPLRLSPYTILLARLCALLHDMAHVPFGHSFEKEGRIFAKDEWADERRRNRIFGPTSSFAKFFVHAFEAEGVTKAAALKVLEDIESVLTCDKKNIHDLRYPFVHDLVGNTICADLVDYVQRDMYFCGLTESLGQRFLEYLAVMPLKKEDDEDTFVSLSSAGDVVFPTRREGTNHVMCRLVLLEYRYNERKVAIEKPDIVREAIDLVRRRLTVAEKLYFHRTKIAASAMLVAAAQATRLDAMRIWEMSDREVLKELSRAPEPRSNILATKLLNRALFKPIYRVSYRKPDETSHSDELWHEKIGAYARFKDPKEQLALIERLERVIGRHVNPDRGPAYGTVCVYCPDRRMNLKAFDMLVLQNPQARIKRLQDSDSPTTRLEIDAIQAAHEHLWHLAVLVDPESIPLESRSEFSWKLAGAIQSSVGPKNEIKEFAEAESVNLDQWEKETTIDNALHDCGVATKVTMEHYRELAGQSFKTDDDFDARVRGFLVEKKYLVEGAASDDGIGAKH